MIVKAQVTIDGPKAAAWAAITNIGHAAAFVSGIKGIEIVEKPASGLGVTLTESHESRPQGIAATLMAIPMRLFFTGVIRKALLPDLNDIKAAAEAGRFSGPSPTHASR